MKYEFQIYISNQKINIQNYILNLDSVSKQNPKTEAKEYIKAIKQELEKEKIYVTKYYIIIALDRTENEDIMQVDTMINKLNNIGCKARRIKVKKELCKILYEGINKEVVS